MHMNRTWLFSTLLLLGWVCAAQAEIYTWVDDQGVRHYSDRATSAQAREADLPGIQTVEGTDPGRAGRRSQDWNNAAADRPPDSRLPELLQPQPQAMIRSAGVVPIAVAVGEDGLRAGEQVVYYLDGSPVAGSPTSALQLQLGGVPPGSHTLSVALLYQGTELRRTDAITFFMRPPTAIRPVNETSPGAPENQPRGAAVAPPVATAPAVPAAPRFNIRPGADAPPM